MKLLSVRWLARLLLAARSSPLAALWPPAASATTAAASVPVQASVRSCRLGARFFGMFPRPPGRPNGTDGATYPYVRSIKTGPRADLP